ncbi:MAG TPA: alkaline phosphatase family protein [Solirubrobacterales bacterium]|nr:alkaline phosphatase family protein [Solirubrobacterales bacterium]
MSPPPTPVPTSHTPVPASPPLPDEAELLHRLGDVKHVVVLMMENRSFDQMLGFLGKHGRVEGVRGLQGDEVNYDEEGNAYHSFEWGDEQTSFHPPQDHSGKILDPCHGPGCVAEQLQTYRGQSPGGYVKNFLRRKDKQGNLLDIPAAYRGLPMGYYTERHLPVYDMLGRDYAVCDAWHSSIPGDTWPNRLYAMAGQEGEPVTREPGLLQDLANRLRQVPPLAELANAPIFDVAAFTRHLRDSQWRWYSHDPATLRGADGRYRDFTRHRENFAYFDRKRISLLTKAVEGLTVELHDSFLDDAAKGQLRDVSWIDPNFIDLKLLDPNSNDDHPPSDVRAGQALVLEVYEALVNSPGWRDTVLVVVYDEHGGFYDHVIPPPVPAGDPAKYETLGVRVPALVVGPRVQQGCCHHVFEHTSLISTILRRFADDPAAALGRMPARVHGAPHLGAVLESGPRQEALDRERLQEKIDEARDRLDNWRRRDRRRRRARAGAPSPVKDGGAGQDQELLDWQEQFLGFALKMRNGGLPPGQP